jgi:N-acetylmuramoyl-L-alanine amidase
MYNIQNDVLWQSNSTGNWDQIEFFPTPNKSGTITPKYLIIHYTAGAAGARATAQYFQKPEAKTSAHLNLDVDGTWAQNVEFNVKAWHAGKSSWAGDKNLNDCSIGIEVCNPGPLTITRNGYQTWWGATIDNPKIIEAPHQNDPNGPVYGWVPFTEAQVEALIEVGQLLMQEYGLQEALGHDMISPGRKTDPGPCMNYRVYDKINAYAAGTQGNWEWYVANVQNFLNMRSGPGGENSVVAQLPKDSALEILSRQGIWWNVETDEGQQGWVHSKFLGTRRVND